MRYFNDDIEWAEINRSLQAVFPTSVCHRLKEAGITRASLNDPLTTARLLHEDLSAVDPVRYSLVGSMRMVQELRRVYHHSAVAIGIDWAGIKSQHFPQQRASHITGNGQVMATLLNRITDAVLRRPMNATMHFDGIERLMLDVCIDPADCTAEEEMGVALAGGELRRTTDFVSDITNRFLNLAGDLQKQLRVAHMMAGSMGPMLAYQAQQQQQQQQQAQMAARLRAAGQPANDLLANSALPQYAASMAQGDAGSATAAATVASEVIFWLIVPSWTERLRPLLRHLRSAGVRVILGIHAHALPTSPSGSAPEELASLIGCTRVLVFPHDFGPQTRALIAHSGNKKDKALQQLAAISPASATAACLSGQTQIFSSSSSSAAPSASAAPEPAVVSPPVPKSTFSAEKAVAATSAAAAASASNSNKDHHLAEAVAASSSSSSAAHGGNSATEVVTRVLPLLECIVHSLDQCKGEDRSAEGELQMLRASLGHCYRNFVKPSQSQIDHQTLRNLLEEAVVHNFLQTGGGGSKNGVQQQDWVRLTTRGINTVQIFSSNKSVRDAISTLTAKRAAHAAASAGAGAGASSFSSSFPADNKSASEKPQKGAARAKDEADESNGPIAATAATASKKKGEATASVPANFNPDDFFLLKSTSAALVAAFKTAMKECDMSSDAVKALLCATWDTAVLIKNDYRGAVLIAKVGSKMASEFRGPKGHFKNMCRAVDQAGLVIFSGTTGVETLTLTDSGEHALLTLKARSAPSAAKHDKPADQQESSRKQKAAAAGQQQQQQQQAAALVITANKIASGGSSGTFDDDEEDEIIKKVGRSHNYDDDDDDFQQRPSLVSVTTSIGGTASNNIAAQLAALGSEGGVPLLGGTKSNGNGMSSNLSLIGKSDRNSADNSDVSHLLGLLATGAPGTTSTSLWGNSDGSGLLLFGGGDLPSTTAEASSTSATESSALTFKKQDDDNTRLHTMRQFLIVDIPASAASDDILASLASSMRFNSTLRNPSLRVDTASSGRRLGVGPFSDEAKAVEHREWACNQPWFANWRTTAQFSVTSMPRAFKLENLA